MKKKALLGIIGIAAVISAGSIASIANNTLEENVIAEVGDISVEVVEENDFRIRELKENGILIGDEKGELGLGNTLKRQEMIVLISRLMGKEEEAKNWDTSKLTYKDVGKNSWSSGYIAWAKDNEITKGYSEEWFGYNDELTEEQTGIFILRVLGYEEADVENATEIAAEIGIIDYYGELSKTAINRGKVGLMIYNALYCNMKESEKELREEIGAESIYSEEEARIALTLEMEGIEYGNTIENGEWKVVYVKGLAGETEEKIKAEKEIYYTIAENLEYNPYVMIDMESNKKIEVVSYKEYGVIYQIKVDGKVVYDYTEEAE